MAPARTLSVVVVRAVCAAMMRAGADVPAMLREIGIAPEQLADADARLPAELAFRVMEEAPRRTNDPLFALHAPAAIPAGAAEVLEFVGRSSRTVGELLSRVARYYALLDDRSEARLETHDAHADARFFVRATAKPLAPRAATELLFAYLFERARALTGNDLALRAVHFQAEGPSDATGYESFFHAPVRFSQPANELVIDRASLDVPILTADAALASFLDRQAEILLARTASSPRPDDDSLVDRVRRLVADTLQDGDLPIDVAAKRLAVSPRTLQRRLGEASTTYAELNESVRRELATQYLANPALAIAEIAYLLGFSQTSAFHRAFKRWTGHTPVEHRRHFASWKIPSPDRQ
jgi:AraC-like DNA-binding protein